MAEVSDLGQASIEHATDLLKSSSRDEAALRKELRESDLTASNPNRGRTRIEIKAIDGYDERKAEALFARFVRNGIWHCPTLVNKLNASEDSQPPSKSLWKYVPPASQERWVRTRPEAPASGNPNERSKYVRKTAEVVGAMDRAGVRILAGTDSPNPFVPGFALHGELGLLVEAGLTPLAALRTATVNPAKFLGREKELGSVERGKLADLVLLDANPLESIGNTQKISAVVANGRLFDRKALDAMLAQAEAAANRK